MAQRYARASTLFFNSLLVLLPEKVEELTVFWESKLAGGSVDWEALQEPFAVRYAGIGDRAYAAAGGRSQGGGQIAIVPLYGVLSQRMNLMAAMSGGTSTQQFANALREQVNSPQVKAIIVDIDSPGGAVAGTQEAADVIYGLRGTKPIIAQVNSLAASGAYWLASQMDEVVATPSADLGHIGVATLLVDRSGETEAAGVKVRQVTAGKYKHEQAMGSDLVPMTDEKIAHAQQRVDEAYSMFVSSVARGRGVPPAKVRNGFGEGRLVGAKEAVANGLADRIATLDQTVQRFAGGGRVSRPSGATGAQVDRLAIETEQRERAYAYETVGKK